MTAAARRAQFQAALLSWYREHRRDLPWRGVEDPYAVLISEIMLQQTQVARVVPKFEQFMARFPDPAALAAAPVADVVRAWQGLGYNRRAVSLHRAAQAIVERHSGRIPADLGALQALPGIGAYTARAILAFAFAEHAAPVDTNVARVVARAVAGAALRGVALQSAADAAVPSGRARDWSAAVMDLGAAYCTTRPRCGECPVAAACAWRRRGGDDPAALRRSPPAPFAGSNRYHRGRLLDALRRRSLTVDDLRDAAALDDTAAARRVADGLVADGLAQWDGASLRLPA